MLGIKINDSPVTAKRAGISSGGGEQRQRAIRGGFCGGRGGDAVRCGTADFGGVSEFTAAEAAWVRGRRRGPRPGLKKLDGSLISVHTIS